MKDGMNIGMGVPTLGFQGGIERHAHDLARSLAARGHRVVLLHGAGRGHEAERYAAAFADVRPLAHPLAGAGLDVAYVHKATHLGELAALSRIPLAIGAHDHDLTCLRSHRYTPVGRTPCHRAPGLACLSHGCVVLKDRRPEAPLPITLRSPFTQRRNLSALAARAPLVACSAYVAASLVAAGVDPGRVHVVHPVPPWDETPLAPRPSAPRLLVVGQLVRGKGFDIAIEALRHLPPQVTLDVAGDGEDRRLLEEQGARVAPGRVRFHGYVPAERVGALYDAASVVLVPSRWPEPFGMVGIEAMRRARPVVAAAHGGIPEWLVEGRGGRLVAPGRADDLARGVRAALADPEEGSRALAHVRARFSHASTVSAVERILFGLRGTTRDAGPARAGTPVANQASEA